MTKFKKLDKEIQLVKNARKEQWFRKLKYKIYLKKIKNLIAKFTIEEILEISKILKPQSFMVKRLFDTDMDINYNIKQNTELNLKNLKICNNEK